LPNSTRISITAYSKNSHLWVRPAAKTTTPRRYVGFQSENIERYNVGVCHQYSAQPICTMLHPPR